MKKKTTRLTVSEKVRQYYNHCILCGLWLRNDKLDEKLVCTYCNEKLKTAPLPEDI